MQDRILIVDDDELVLTSYARMLARKFNVDTAMTAQAALDAIRSRGPYAVVVSDLRMPGMSGLQLIERAKVLSPDVVGIVLSGDADPSELASNAVFRALEKPCSTADLSDALNAAVAHHHALCERSTGQM
jgi:DNA-binding NtrC family response regulator